MSMLQGIAEAIERLDVKTQFKLLQELPDYLKVSTDDIVWSLLAEPATLRTYPALLLGGAGGWVAGQP